MAVLLRYPMDAIDIDAIVVGQDAAHPGDRGLAVRSHSHALAGQIGRRERATGGAVHNGVVLEAAHYGGGQEDERLAVGLRLQKGRDRHFADVEFQLPHHRLEEAIGRLDVGKVERNAIRLDLAVLERARLRIIVEGDVERRNPICTHCGTHCDLLPSLRSAISLMISNETATTMTLILSNADVEKLLTMPECIEALEQSYEIGRAHV